MAKEKQFFVDFEFKAKITGYVTATSIKAAKAKILEDYDQPFFGNMDDYSVDAEATIEFESVVPEGDV